MQLYLILQDVHILIAASSSPLYALLSFTILTKWAVERKTGEGCSGKGGPRGKRKITHMFNEVTDDAIIKVFHLCPWYALAREERNCRSRFK